jgi:hypothetical protein
VRKSHAELMDGAVKQLREFGFNVSEPPLEFEFGKIVCSKTQKILSRDGCEDRVLIQTRSFQADSKRYLVGVLFKELSKVQSYVLWFEKEPYFLKFPAGFLISCHESAKATNRARYTGEDQWRINVELTEKIITPQGISGCEISIEAYCNYWK